MLNIENGEFDQVTKERYTEYALAVILSRAIPSIEDGLLPVMRRSLFSSYNVSKSKNENAFTKAATFVGAVLGSYHPHGDSSAYDSIVNLSQTFKKLNTLFDAQGNNGSVGGDSAAAMRYLELRVSKFARDVFLKDTNLDLLRTIPNFDGSLMEPFALQPTFPTILNVGIEGIAPGFTCAIPTHSVHDIIGITKKYINNPDITCAELVKDFRPDFSIGGRIVNEADAVQTYCDGNGVFVVEANIEEVDYQGKRCLQINDLPYGVTLNSVNEQIRLGMIPPNTKGKEKTTGVFIDYIQKIIDLSDAKKNILVKSIIIPKRGVTLGVLQNLLYKHTNLRKSVKYECNVLYNNTLKERINIKELIALWMDNRISFVRSRVTHEMQRIIENVLLMKALMKAHGNIDAVYKTIKTAGNKDDVVKALMDLLDIGVKEATYIADIRFHKISKLSVKELKQNIVDAEAKVNKLSEIIRNDDLIIDIIEEEMDAVDKKYGKEKRKTDLSNSFTKEFDVRTVIESEDLVVAVTTDGLVYARPASELRETKRNAKGINFFTNSKKQKTIRETFTVNTHDNVLLFSKDGKVYKIKGYDLNVKNVSLSSIAGSDGEINTVLPVSEKDLDKYIVLCSKLGLMKRIGLAEILESNYKSLIVMGKIPENDELLYAKLSLSEIDNIMVLVSSGYAQRMLASCVAIQQRVSRGQPKTELKEGESIVGLSVGTADDHFYTVVCSNGKGKLLDVNDVSLRTRLGGTRVPKKVMVMEKSDILIGGCFVDDGDKIILNTSDNKVVKIDVEGLPLYKPRTKGSKVVNLNASETIISVTKTKD